MNEFNQSDYPATNSLIIALAGLAGATFLSQFGSPYGIVGLLLGISVSIYYLYGVSST